MLRLMWLVLAVAALALPARAAQLQLQVGNVVQYDLVPGVGLANPVSQPGSFQRTFAVDPGAASYGPFYGSHPGPLGFGSSYTGPFDETGTRREASGSSAELRTPFSAAHDAFLNSPPGYTASESASYQISMLVDTVAGAPDSGIRSGFFIRLQGERSRNACGALGCYDARTVTQYDLWTYYMLAPNLPPLLDQKSDIDRLLTDADIQALFTALPGLPYYSSFVEETSEYFVPAGSGATEGFRGISTRGSIQALAPVPLPAAAWLLLSGLAAMVGFARGSPRGDAARAPAPRCVFANHGYLRAAWPTPRTRGCASPVAGPPSA